MTPRTDDSAIHSTLAACVVRTSIDSSDDGFLLAFNGSTRRRV